jgi:hypothetical protein
MGDEEVKGYKEEHYLWINKLAISSTLFSTTV